MSLLFSNTYPDRPVDHFHRFDEIFTYNHFQCVCRCSVCVQMFIRKTHSMFDARLVNPVSVLLYLGTLGSWRRVVMSLRELVFKYDIVRNSSASSCSFQTWVWVIHLSLFLIVFRLTWPWWWYEHDTVLVYSQLNCCFHLQLNQLIQHCFAQCTYQAPQEAFCTTTWGSMKIAWRLHVCCLGSHSVFGYHYWGHISITYITTVLSVISQAASYFHIYMLCFPCILSVDARSSANWSSFLGHPVTMSCISVGVGKV